MRPLLRRVLWTALAVLPLLTPVAYAQNSGCPELTEAQQRYDNGRFEEAIALVSQCLDGNRGTAAERQRAYRLIGLSYIGQDLRDNAREAVMQLVMLVPNFEADPINDPPQFVQMVEEAKTAAAAQETEDARVAEEAQQIDDAEAERLAEEARAAEAALQAEQAAAARRAEEERLAAETARRIEEQRSREKGGGIGKWLLIGGAVVGGGVLAAVLLGGGDDGDDGISIPTPPGPPPGQ